MHDIIEYFRWLYADFPNGFDISIFVMFIGCIGILLVFKAGDRVMR